MKIITFYMRIVFLYSFSLSEQLIMNNSSLNNIEEQNVPSPTKALEIDRKTNNEKKNIVKAKEILIIGFTDILYHPHFIADIVSVIYSIYKINEIIESFKGTTLTITGLLSREHTQEEIREIHKRYVNGDLKLKLINPSEFNPVVEIIQDTKNIINSYGLEQILIIPDFDKWALNHQGQYKNICENLNLFISFFKENINQVRLLMFILTNNNILKVINIIFSFIPDKSQGLLEILSKIYGYDPVENKRKILFYFEAAVSYLLGNKLLEQLSKILLDINLQKEINTLSVSFLDLYKNNLLGDDIINIQYKNFSDNRGDQRANVNILDHVQNSMQKLELELNNIEIDENRYTNSLKKKKFQQFKLINQVVLNNYNGASDILSLIPLGELRNNISTINCVSAFFLFVECLIFLHNSILNKYSVLTFNTHKEDMEEIITKLEQKSFEILVDKEKFKNFKWKYSQYIASNKNTNALLRCDITHTKKGKCILFFNGNDEANILRFQEAVEKSHEPNGFFYILRQGFDVGIVGLILYIFYQYNLKSEIFSSYKKKQYLLIEENKISQDIFNSKIIEVTQKIINDKNTVDYVENPLISAYRLNHNITPQFVKKKIAKFQQNEGSTDVTQKKINEEIAKSIFDETVDWSEMPEKANKMINDLEESVKNKALQKGQEVISLFVTPECVHEMVMNPSSTTNWDIMKNLKKIVDKNNKKEFVFLIKFGFHNNITEYPSINMLFSQNSKTFKIENLINSIKTYMESLGKNYKIVISSILEEKKTGPELYKNDFARSTTLQNIQTTITLFKEAAKISAKVVSSTSSSQTKTISTMLSIENLFAKLKNKMFYGKMEIEKNLIQTMINNPDKETYKKLLLVNTFFRNSLGDYDYYSSSLRYNINNILLDFQTAINNNIEKILQSNILNNNESMTKNLEELENIFKDMIIFLTNDVKNLFTNISDAQLQLFLEEHFDNMKSLLETEQKEIIQGLSASFDNSNENSLFNIQQTLQKELQQQTILEIDNLITSISQEDHAKVLPIIDIIHSSQLHRQRPYCFANLLQNVKTVIETSTFTNPKLKLYKNLLLSFDSKTQCHYEFFVDEIYKSIITDLENMLDVSKMNMYQFVQFLINLDKNEYLQFLKIILQQNIYDELKKYLATFYFTYFVAMKLIQHPKLQEIFDLEKLVEIIKYTNVKENLNKLSMFGNLSSSVMNQGVASMAIDKISFHKKFDPKKLKNVDFNSFKATFQNKLQSYKVKSIEDFEDLLKQTLIEFYGVEGIVKLINTLNLIQLNLYDETHIKSDNKTGYSLYENTATSFFEKLEIYINFILLNKIDSSLPPIQNPNTK